MALYGVLYYKRCNDILIDFSKLADTGALISHIFYTGDPDSDFFGQSKYSSSENKSLLTSTNEVYQTSRGRGSTVHVPKLKSKLLSKTYEVNVIHITISEEEN